MRREKDTLHKDTLHIEGKTGSVPSLDRALAILELIGSRVSRLPAFLAVYPHAGVCTHGPRYSDFITGCAPFSVSGISIIQAKRSESIAPEWLLRRPSSMGTATPICRYSSLTWKRSA